MRIGFFANILVYSDFAVTSEEEVEISYSVFLENRVWSMTNALTWHVIYRMTLHDGESHAKNC